jgi:hypothetical protein
MHKQKGFLIVILAAALALSSFLAVANASRYSYAFNFNPTNNIPCGSPATVTATTTDSSVKQVRFDWYNPLTHKATSCPPVSKTDGCFKTTFCPDAVCDWLVYAYFLDKNGKSITSPCKWVTVCQNYKYDLVCNPPCGSTVDLNTVVTSTAKTTNSEIYKVNFTWINPAGGKVIVTVTNRQSQMEDGKRVYCFVSTKPLNVVGDWCVKADFIDQQGICQCKKDIIITCRMQYIHVVPEVPMLGTIGISAAMLLGFAIFKLKLKKR